MKQRYEKYYITGEAGEGVENALGFEAYDSESGAVRALGCLKDGESVDVYEVQFVRRYTAHIRLTAEDDK